MLDSQTVTELKQLIQISKGEDELYNYQSSLTKALAKTIRDLRNAWNNEKALRKSKADTIQEIRNIATGGNPDQDADTTELVQDLYDRVVKHQNTISAALVELGNWVPHGNYTLISGIRALQCQIEKKQEYQQLGRRECKVMRTITDEKYQKLLKKGELLGICSQVASGQINPDTVHTVGSLAVQHVVKLKKERDLYSKTCTEHSNTLSKIGRLVDGSEDLETAEHDGSAIVAKVIRELKRFTANERAHDDLCILAKSMISGDIKPDSDRVKNSQSSMIRDLAGLLLDYHRLQKVRMLEKAAMFSERYGSKGETLKEKLQESPYSTFQVVNWKHWDKDNPPKKGKYLVCFSEDVVRIGDFNGHYWCGDGSHHWVPVAYADLPRGLPPNKNFKEEIVWKEFPEHKPTTEREYVCITMEGGETQRLVLAWIEGEWCSPNGKKHRVQWWADLSLPRVY